MPMANHEAPRRWRRTWKVLGLGAGLLAVAFAGLPWLLGTTPARRWLLARANRALAPGSVRVETIRLSWFGPTRLTGVALVDAQGDRVIAAPRATWDRSLAAILALRGHLGTLTLDGATLDIERRADGSFDVVDALRPILNPDPRKDFRLRIVGGSLRFRSPGLAGPLVAERARLDLDLPAGLRPVTWRLGLGDRTRHGPSLEISGQADRGRGRGQSSEVVVAVTGRSWPLAIDAGGVRARARFDGRAEARREAGGWRFTGDAQALDLDAGGPALAGDRVKWDRVGGTWEVAQLVEGWAVDRLDLRSPVGTLVATGRVPAPPGSTARIEGDLDLAALSKQMPHILRLREGLALERGSARLRIEGQAGPKGTTWDASARVSDLVARGGGGSASLREPLTISARAGQTADGFDLDRFALKSSFLDVASRGDVDRGIALQGSIDLGALRRQVGDLIDFGGLELDGHGKVTAEYSRGAAGFAGKLTLDLDGPSLGGRFRRDSLQLLAVVSGPAHANGLPRGWEQGHLTLRDGGRVLNVDADARGGAIHVSADGKSPLRLGDRDGLVRAKLVGSWWGEALEIQEGRVGLWDADGKAERINLTAAGRFDSATGELVIASKPSAEAAPLTLAADGLHVSGLGRSAGPLRAEGSLAGDLALLAKALGPWLGTAPEGLAGTLTLHASARSGGDGLHLGGKLGASDVTWGGSDVEGQHGAPALSLDWQAFKPKDADRLDVSELVASAGYATLTLAGRIDGLGGVHQVDLGGTLAPDWDAINRFLTDRVEPGATARGKPRPVRVKGRLAGGSGVEVIRGLDAEVGIDLGGAQAFGMELGPAAIVVRSTRDGPAIDPIRSTLNGGTLRLEPEVGRDAAGDWQLRLKSGSALEGAEINDVVSRRVLAFVAPVLDAATRAHGKVSADVQRAEFPLGGGATRRAVVEGHVVFRDAEFVPGPLVVDLLHLLGRDDPQPVRLDRPVVLSIADGRVHQRGLAVPLGKVTQLELNGSVGFDRTLDLRAGVPITPAMLGNNPLLGGIAAGTRVEVPIGGTLAAPRIDQGAFNLAMKDLGRDLLRRGAGAGAAELLMRLARPRPADPDAPAPPTPEERRALREQRKADRIDRRAERQRDRRGLP